MKNTHLSRRFLRLVVVVIVAVIFLMIYFVAPRPNFPAVTDDNIPLPFGDSGTESLAGQLVTLGQKRGVTVRHVSFDNNEEFEVLRDDEEMHSMDFIVTPDSPTISHGVPLCNAVTAGKKYFGYKYTSRAADDEKDALDAAINLGAPSTLQVLFPGEFFASAEMPQGTGSFIKIFEDGVNEGLAEGETPFSFRDTCDVTLEKNARYVIKVMDSDVSFTARGLIPSGTPLAIRLMPTHITALIGNPRTLVWETSLGNSPALQRHTFIDEGLDHALVNNDQIWLNFQDWNTEPARTTLSFSALPENTVDIQSATLHLLMLNWPDAPDHLRAKLVSDGGDVSDWTPFVIPDAVKQSPVTSNNRLAIPFLLRTNLTPATTRNLKVVIEMQWDERDCGEAGCTNVRWAFFYIHAAELDVGVRCDGACVYVAPVCGNSIVDIFEICDDGNTQNGDYCNAGCSVVTGRCGDGVIQGNEVCDGTAVATDHQCTDQCRQEIRPDCREFSELETVEFPDGSKVRLGRQGEFIGHQCTNWQQIAERYHPDEGWVSIPGSLPDRSFADILRRQISYSGGPTTMMLLPNANNTFVLIYTTTLSDQVTGGNGPITGRCGGRPVYSCGQVHAIVGNQEGGWGNPVQIYNDYLDFGGFEEGENGTKKALFSASAKTREYAPTSWHETNRTFTLEYRDGAWQTAARAGMCGNGVIDNTEVCDDENGTATDGCNMCFIPQCEEASCGFIGDYYKCSGEPSVCTQRCGDGIIDEGEECDAGDTPSDGCTWSCRVKDRWSCTGEPSSCAPLCGNGVIDSIEECDDGNTNIRDGCFNNCYIEQGWQCTGEPSICHAINI